MDVLSIDNIYTELAQELKEVDSLIFESLSAHDDAIRSIGNYVISAGGKRIRPLFNLLFARVFDYSGNSNINISAAVEFFHTATLLHDDVIDDSNTRRGKEATHRKWGNKYAILVGDFLFSKAFKLMISTNSIEVLNVLSTAATVISEGEVKQLKHLKNVKLSQDTYIEILRAKTAELFAVASKTAAIIANQSEKTKSAAYEFGIDFGIGFQLIDDILDYTSSDSGKDAGKDFYEGKVTLPIILLLKHCDVEERAFIMAIFNEDLRSKTDFNLLMAILNKYNIFALAQSVVTEYLLAAKQTYDNTIKSQDKRGLIASLLMHYMNKIAR